MKKSALSLSPALAILLFGALSMAQAKPNFSGEWKFDAEKSNFGPMPTPSIFTRKITQNDPKLHVVTTQSGPQGERTSEAEYSTDGTEVVNKTRGAEAKSTAAWEGEALNITTKIDVEGNSIVLKEKWTLSGDGKLLTTALHATTPQGEFEITIVMNKQ